MWMSLCAFALHRYRPLRKQRAKAHKPRKPDLRAAPQVDGELAREESHNRRHWKNNEGVQIKWADPEAAQPVENKERRPGHSEGPDACIKAPENIPLSQNGHSESEKDHQVPSQLHDVQIVSEAIFRNDREPGPISKNKLLITINGHLAVSSPWTRSDGWVNCFSGTWGGTMISFSSPRTRFGPRAHTHTKNYGVEKEAPNSLSSWQIWSHIYWLFSLPLLAVIQLEIRN